VSRGDRNHSHPELRNRDARRASEGDGVDAERSTLDRAILAWMGEPVWLRDDARFDSLALGLFRFQYAHCEPYRRYCDSLGRDPANVARADDVPAVPTGAFKEFELRCFPAEQIRKTFRTSGTSSERRGTLHLDTLVLYETSLLASLRHTFLVELCGRRPRMRFLASSPEAAPDSSLTHMFAVLAAAEGHADSGFDFSDAGLELESLATAIARARAAAEPIIVAGTSFAFVHLLDATRADSASRWTLPAGSRVLETGGFKGRSREVPRERLRAELAARFGIGEHAVLNQYGMTELGSQFYDSTRVDPGGIRRKLVPPWTRVRCVDPDSGRDVPAGEVGMIVIHDLANTGSVAALQTADHVEADAMLVDADRGPGRGPAPAERGR
jgi:Acyl-protein synthetase, LuxE